MNQIQNKTQQTLSFPEVIIYRSQRAIYVPQDESNEMVVRCDEDGNITLIPAREVFTQLYKEPAPTY